MPSGRCHQRMQHRPAGVAEEGRPCPWVLPRPGWATVLRFSCLLLLGIVICCLIFCSQLWRQKQTQLKPIKCPVLNPTGRLTSILILFTFCPPAGPRKDPTLRWAAGPALGRSFTHGPGLEKGQLYIHREGIYRLHIQVTLANCSSAYSTIQHRATVAVGICSPAAHSISLLRLPFGQSCTVASQRLTHLAVGDVLCTNLTLPLLPSRNSEETFFGIHWVYP
ncbi:CD70 antigen [Cricetulus griseus]|uniref:CD70 antigen n=1 Tax=Cricetulus griseus TaxID=10029 RepID=G3HCL4_CRIGR|nr:CD70 antigen [Cricetulus griseus]